jgi:PAS domain S-box-containing protein
MFNLPRRHSEGGVPDMKADFTDAELPASLCRIFERSKVALTVADYTAPDCPLVGVNVGFCELTGYDPDEVLGRNCRFLQPANGAGPVRERMRAYLGDEKMLDEKFVIPNVKRDGTPFLNLVYMSKLTLDGKVALVLASQFGVMRAKQNDFDLYDRALGEDMQQLSELTADTNWAVLGSVEALASSYSIIARFQIL